WKAKREDVARRLKEPRPDGQVSKSTERAQFDGNKSISNNSDKGLAVISRCSARGVRSVAKRAAVNPRTNVGLPFQRVAMWLATCGTCALRPYRIISSHWVERWTTGRGC